MLLLSLTADKNLSAQKAFGLFIGCAMGCALHWYCPPLPSITYRDGPDHCWNRLRERTALQPASGQAAETLINSVQPISGLCAQRHIFEATMLRKPWCLCNEWPSLHVQVET